MPAPPDPNLLEMSIEPRDERDRPRLLAALGTDDDDGDGRIDRTTGRIKLCGTSEEDLLASHAALQDRSGVALRPSAIQIAYRETIARRIEIDTTHKKPLAGGTFEFARVKLAFEPGAGWSFEAAQPDIAFPAAFLAGVEAGLAAARRTGVLAGFPVRDVRARLLDGAWRDEDSFQHAVEIAALTAFRRALSDVGVVMEPIMRAEIRVGAAFVRALHGNLLVRRAEIEARSREGDKVTLIALVPLANMLGYRRSLDALAEGTGSLRLAFSHFAPIPRPEPPHPQDSMARPA